MKKSVIVIVCAALVTSLTFTFTFTACGSKTSGDAANPLPGVINEPLAQPSEELLNQIKSDYLKKWNRLNEETLYIIRYYGEYDCSVPIMLVSGELSYTMANVEQLIAGSYFHYPDGKTIEVWNSGYFYSMQEAYEAGLLTKEQVAVISYLHEREKYIKLSTNIF